MTCIKGVLIIAWMLFLTGVFIGLAVTAKDWGPLIPATFFLFVAVLGTFCEWADETEREKAQEIRGMK